MNIPLLRYFDNTLRSILSHLDSPHSLTSIFQSRRHFLPILDLTRLKFRRNFAEEWARPFGYEIAPKESVNRQGLGKDFPKVLRVRQQSTHMKDRGYLPCTCTRQCYCKRISYRTR